ncbi:MAG TPA: DUF1684 domain-containing protein [Candidatus Limnocylindria bacterium]|nr:DUF1684 domain-containing protein [Candidatus Limnocylindria bacterium]
MSSTDPTSEHLALADWRRRVHAMYGALRADERPGPMRAVAFRAAKDRLVAEHPSSPVPPEGRRDFRGLAYWRHVDDLVLRAMLEPDPEAPAIGVPRSGEGLGIPFQRIGWVSFAVAGVECRLSVFWLNEYSGGIFIPFRDGTSGSASYGGGRYLWDSAKGADLGSSDGQLVLDFNYAYHPSCVFDPRWSCPLAPQENWLQVPVEAGERLDRVAGEEAA